MLMLFLRLRCFPWEATSVLPASCTGILPADDPGQVHSIGMWLHGASLSLDEQRRPLTVDHWGTTSHWWQVLVLDLEGEERDRERKDTGLHRVGVVDQVSMKNSDAVQWGRGQWRCRWNFPVAGSAFPIGRVSRRGTVVAVVEPRALSPWLPPPSYMALCDGGPPTANGLSASRSGRESRPN
jgi:hypothetical protein